MIPNSATVSAGAPAAIGEVVHFHRKPPGDSFSIESHFAELRELLQPRFTVRAAVMPCMSQGLLPRLQNARAAKAAQGDVNHIVGDSHYLALALDPRRTILTVLDCDMLERTRGVRRELLKLFWFRWPARRVAAITVISEATRRALLHVIDFPVEKIHVVPVFINERFQHAPQVFNAERPTILQIGTRHNKNFERLILALEGEPCRLVVIGNPTDEQRRLLHETNVEYEVYFQQTDEQMVEHYRRADLLCFASTNEGFGMPILEAQAVGRPVITGNCASMPEVAGDAALLVNPNSVAEIREAVRRVRCDADYRAKLVERGLVNVERFSATRIADQYGRLYESILQ